MKQVWKGLLITVITFIASTIASGGFAGTALAWETLGITTLGTVLIYLAQSFAFPSTSIIGELNLKDLAKGAFVTLGNFFSAYTASTVTTGHVDWKSLFISAGSVFAMYILKQLGTTVPPTQTK
ncbi:hypothetical protein ACFOW1_01640 [Parasediminibacterium paludis]|uniref:Major facilitator superfamily (MFS) profile domain-containing protein n=1 Tax=Parasediminibacterium paludis TaxID=908966 RepID=A0ABV8PR25_9BACT